MLIVQYPKNLLKQLLRSINVWTSRVNSSPFALPPWQYTFCWYTPDTVPRKTTRCLFVYCGENTRSKKWMLPHGYRDKCVRKAALDCIYIPPPAAIKVSLQAWEYAWTIYTFLTHLSRLLSWQSASAVVSICGKETRLQYLRSSTIPSIHYYQLYTSCPQNY